MCGANGRLGRGWTDAEGEEWSPFHCREQDEKKHVGMMDLGQWLMEYETCISTV